MTELERLKKKHVKVLDNGCWEWQGALTKGYGQLTYNYVHWIAHRLFFMLFYGKIDNTKELHHAICNYKRCVNPEHVKQVDPGRHPGKIWGKDNPGYRKHRINNRCARGHEMTAENTYKWNNRTQCLACRNINNAFRTL